MIKKRGQVWVETVLYTLIGLALIGLVLAFVTSKINEARDRITVDQTINSLNAIDEKVNAVLDAPGNRRFVEFTMKRGEFFVSPESNEIRFVISDLVKPYSEVGKEISVGRIVILSEEGQRDSIVTLTLSYEGIADIEYAGEEKEKKFTAASIPYKFSITNLGADEDFIKVNIEESTS